MPPTKREQGGEAACKEVLYTVDEAIAALGSYRFKAERTPGKRLRSASLVRQIAAFDIETTGIPSIRQSVLYHWQFQLDLDFTVTGRTWGELIEWFDALSASLGYFNLVVWVHNLNYEFQFLAGVLDIDGGDVRCMGSRDVLRFKYRHLDFRCSFKQLGMSLAAACEKWKVFHGKLSGGDFNYRKQRFPWTELTPEELEYCLNDVRGLVEVMYKRRSGDSNYTMPLTKTGYIRRRAKEALKWRLQQSKDEQSDFGLYKMLREAFRGGNTHANRFYAGRVLHDIGSSDRSSSYPDTMVNDLFPSGRFTVHEPGEFETLYQEGREALVFRLRIWDIHLKIFYWGFPYLPFSKCRKVVHPDLDNGRILEAEFLETTMTDVDFDILTSEYDFEYEIIELRGSPYAPLPDEFIALINALYKDKTELKGVAGKEDEYHRSKENINSAYGMMVQDPGKRDYEFIPGDERNGGFVQVLGNDEDHYYEMIGNTPLLYAWGVWVTAWARFRLEEALMIAGEQAVYTDTDSVKHFGEVDFTEYNRQRMERSIQNGGVASDRGGVTHYLGVMETEHRSALFITYGAKKYATMNENGKLEITIAGVPKRKGAEELEKYGGIDALREGFVFRESGRTESVYNDTAYGPYDTGEGVVDVTRNLYIEDTTYTLHLTDEYRELIFSAGQVAEIRRKLFNFFGGNDHE